MCPISVAVKLSCRGPVRWAGLGGLVVALVGVLSLMVGVPGARAASFGSAVTIGSGFISPAWVAVDGAGDVFVTDNDNSRVVEVPAAGGSQVTIGSGFVAPEGVAVDGAGDVFVAEAGNNRVVEVPAGGGAQHTIGSGFNYPFGLTVDGAGDVFVADNGNNRVVEVPAGGGPQHTIGSGFSHPDDAAVDATGDVFVTQADNHQVVEVPAAGGPQVTIGSGLTQPDGVAVDGAGDLFVADNGNSQVVEMPAGGGAQVTIGSGFSIPGGVTVDGAGDVFVADNGNSRVVELPVVVGSSTVLGSSEDPSGPNDAVTYTATVSRVGGGVVSRGTVAFRDGSSVIAGCATVALSSVGVATCTVDPAGVLGSSNQITAAYSGDSTNTTYIPSTPDFSGSTSNTVTQSVKLSQSIVWGQQGPYAFGQAPVTLDASASSGLAVSYTVQSGPCTVNGSTLTLTGAGSCVLGAAQAGDSDYLAASQLSQTIVINTATPAFVAAPANITPPAITGTTTTGQTLACSTGAWANIPTSYMYQWSRDGTPIVGATGAAYQVQAIDEGNTLTCATAAVNAAGIGVPVTSAAVLVPVPYVPRCPAATGKLSGQTIGLVKLGDTRKQAEKAYTHSSNRGTRYEEFFCLTPIGIRVGYASPKAVAHLPAGKRKALNGRVIWISTSSAYYAIDTIRPGATITAAEKKLKVGKVFRIGLNDWYLAPYGPITVILKVRDGIVEETGIANKQLTAGRRAQRTFLTSFS